MVPVWELAVGDCWDQPDDEGFLVLDCDQPHEGEVFGLPPSDQCGISIEMGEMVDQFDVAGALSDYAGVPPEQLEAWGQENNLIYLLSGEPDPQGEQACAYSLASADGEPLTVSHRAD